MKAIKYTTELEHNGYLITVAENSHCASIFKGGILIRMITGNIYVDGSHDAVDKAKLYINIVSNRG